MVVAYDPPQEKQQGNANPLNKSRAIQPHTPRQPHGKSDTDKEYQQTTHQRTLITSDTRKDGHTRQGSPTHGKLQSPNERKAERTADRNNTSTRQEKTETTAGNVKVSDGIRGEERPTEFYKGYYHSIIYPRPTDAKPEEQTTTTAGGKAMEQKKVKDLKKGEFFTLKDYGEYPPESRVYVRGEYERSEKKFSCYKFTDVNHESFFKGNKIVFVGFTF